MTNATPPLRDSYEGIYQRAQNALAAGDFPTALELYQRLVERLGRLSDRVLARRPELGAMHVQARRELAKLLELDGRYAEALEVAQSLLEEAEEPEHREENRRNVAILRVAKGEVERGLAELRTLAEEAPEDAERWITLAAQARIEGRFAVAEEALDRALDVAVVHHERFELFKKMKRVDEALAAWEQAVAHDPELTRHVRDVYQLLTDAGRYGDALCYVERDENEMQAGFQRGLIASRTGNQLQAREAWEAVAELDPFEYEYGHDAWAEALLRLEEPDRALEKLQYLLPRYGDPRLLVLSGIGWAMKGDVPLAAMLFQQAIGALRRQRPPKKKLPGEDWRLLDTLVEDEQVKAPLRTYFAVIETVWDAPGRAARDRVEQVSGVLRP